MKKSFTETLKKLTHYMVVFDVTVVAALACGGILHIVTGG